MSTIMEYIRRTTDGMASFMGADKTVALLLAVILLFWLQEKKTVNATGNRLLVYTMSLSVLLLCPVTAVVGVIYQTAFYDYEWLWSMVPVTIVLSYALVLLYDTKVEKTNRKQNILCIVVFVLVLFWCGNQGMVKTVPSKEAQHREKASEVAAWLKDTASEAELVLWAPADIMQETRRQTGKVELLYGRDMWEAKAGAYDYEAYSESVIEVYEWMKDSEEIAGDGENLLKIIKILWETEEMNARLQKVMQVLRDNGVNVIVMPIETVELFEDSFFVIAEEWDATVEKTQIESFMIYRLK